MELQRFIGLKPAPNALKQSITGPYNTMTRAIITADGAIHSFSPVELAHTLIEAVDKLNMADGSSIKQLTIANTALQAIFKHTIEQIEKNTQETTDEKVINNNATKVARWNDFMAAVKEGRISEADGSIIPIEPPKNLQNHNV